MLKHVSTSRAENSDAIEPVSWVLKTYYDRHWAVRIDCSPFFTNQLKNALSKRFIEEITGSQRQEKPPVRNRRNNCGEGMCGCLLLLYERTLKCWERVQGVVGKYSSQIKRFSHFVLLGWLHQSRVYLSPVS